MSNSERNDVLGNHPSGILTHGDSIPKTSPAAPPSMYLQSQYGPLVQVQNLWNPYSTPSATQSPGHRPLSPGSINKLPPELLGEILESSLEGWNCVTVESLMAVCGAWMGICLQTPALWTKVVLGMTYWATPDLYERRSSYIHHHLSRSGILQMRITVNISPSAQHGTMTGECIPLAQAVLHLLSTGGPTNKGARHWSTLEVSFNSSTPRRLLDFLGAPLPCLRELTINGEGDGEGDLRLPIMQLPALRELRTTGFPTVTGYFPENLQYFSLATATLNPGAMDHLASLETLSLTLEKNNDLPLRKVTLPNLRSLEITITPSSQPRSPSEIAFQPTITAEPVSLRYLILPRLHTLIVTNDNPSLRAVTTLRDLRHVRRLELTEREFLAPISRATGWGFLASSVIRTPALVCNPSSTLVEYMLSQCIRLEEVQASPSTTEFLNGILNYRPDLRPSLRLLQSKYEGTLKTVAIKGLD
jgi:F-box-like